MKLVYDFSEGSRETRDLLGGKGANVTERMRIFGPEGVPTGFTITAEACVSYMGADEFRAALNDQVAAAVARLKEQAARRPGGPVAGVGPLRRPRVDARDAGLDRVLNNNGIDYVSCSPYQVPVARVAAAQAAINSSRTSGGVSAEPSLREGRCLRDHERKD